MSKEVAFMVPDKLHELLAGVGREFGLSPAAIARHIVFDVLIKGGFKTAAQAEQEPEEEAQTAGAGATSESGTAVIKSPSNEMIEMLKIGSYQCHRGKWAFYDLSSDAFKAHFNVNLPLPLNRFAAYLEASESQEAVVVFGPGVDCISDTIRLDQHRWKTTTA